VQYFYISAKNCTFAEIKKSKIMATAVIEIPFQKDLLQRIDRFVEKKAASSREDLIFAAIEMYIQRKQNWQNLFSYGEQLALEKNLSENDVINEVKANRRGK
jgi:metal-responsive CopG/Arc/MetJ family transcriptional regulator